MIDSTTNFSYIFHIYKNYNITFLKTKRVKHTSQIHTKNNHITDRFTGRTIVPHHKSIHKVPCSLHRHRGDSSSSTSPGRGPPLAPSRALPPPPSGRGSGAAGGGPPRAPWGAPPPPPAGGGPPPPPPPPPPAARAR
jgi:hypothetical protein